MVNRWWNLSFTSAVSYVSRYFMAYPMKSGLSSSHNARNLINPITPLPVDEPLKENAIRFVCVSDTHGRHKNYRVPIPFGDVLIHAGDFTMIGTVKEVNAFNNFLGSLPHPHKIVIAGNHDLSFDHEVPCDNFHANRTIASLQQQGLRSAHPLLTNCCYLENTSVDVAGYKIFGSPQSPEFGSWAFMYERGSTAKDQWERIPDDTAILITHGPPLGFGDLLYNGGRAGCAELLQAVQERVKPKFHVFGHIHEDNSMTSDGTTTFINASICDLRYRPNNPPYIFDLPMPEGVTRSSLHKMVLTPETCRTGAAEGMEITMEDSPTNGTVNPVT